MFRNFLLIKNKIKEYGNHVRKKAYTYKLFMNRIVIFKFNKCLKLNRQ